jgi:hypothetical protein
VVAPPDNAVRRRVPGYNRGIFLVYIFLRFSPPYTVSSEVAFIEGAGCVFALFHELQGDL